MAMVIAIVGAMMALARAAAMLYSSLKSLPSTGAWTATPIVDDEVTKLVRCHAKEKGYLLREPVTCRERADYHVAASSLLSISSRLNTFTLTFANGGSRSKSKSRSRSKSKARAKQKQSKSNNTLNNTLTRLLPSYTGRSSTSCLQMLHVLVLEGSAIPGWNQCRRRSYKLPVVPVVVVMSL